MRMPCQLFSIAAAVLLVFTAGCASPPSSRIPRPTTGGRVYLLETTGYCPCRECCGWKRNWLGRPVFASGSLKGRSKPIGMCASGVYAQPGTLAADTRLFPFGTLMYIPGYGYGRVEDRGEKIKGFRVDLYFESHEQALQWGRSKKQARVWRPSPL